MPEGQYPIGSPGDLIINVLPRVFSEFRGFLDIAEAYLRDFQLDLRYMTAETVDPIKMAEELQVKIEQLQVETRKVSGMTSAFQGMVDEVGKQL